MKDQSRFEGKRLTNGMPIDEWVKSFPTQSERMLAAKAAQHCIDNGEILSEVMLRFTMGSLRPSAPENEVEAYVQETRPKVVDKDKTRKRPGLLFTFLAILLVAGIAFFSNPGPQKHQEEISQSLTVMAKANMLEQAEENPFVFLFGGIAIDLVVNQLVSELSYHNYYLFSTTTFDLPDGSKTMSVGAFGKVFSVSSQDLKAAAAEMLEENDQQE